MSIAQNIANLKKTLGDATLIAVSKTKPVVAIEEAYAAGQRDFGENYVQELTEKQPKLPVDIRWHFIGHLQSNKIKYIAPFVYLIHGVDSLRLLREINKQGVKCGRVIDCLLQVYIAKEESKFGFDRQEVLTLVQSGALHDLSHVRICGLMGMASNTDHAAQVAAEYNELAGLFHQLKSSETANFQMLHLSGGMSADYPLALTAGCNMVRIGSTIFGQRDYSAK